MNILITGASGYIGRNLAAHLAGEGHRVTALVRQSHPDLQKNSAIHVQEVPGYHDPDWNDVRLFAGQDVVIHAAAHVHSRGDRSAECYRRDNLDFTLRIAHLAAQAGVKRFLFLSSVGAQHLEERFHEGRITQPQAWKTSPYRMSKFEAERSLRALAKKENLSVLSIRLPMVYGAGAPGSFSKLAQLIRYGVPLPFKEFIEPRAFVSIETVKDFVSFALKHPEGDGRIWAIRDADEISPRDFAFAVARAGKYKPPRIWSCPRGLLEFGAGLLGQQQTARSLAEPTHINLQPVEQKLGWHPRLTTAEGLEKAFI